uniref:Uncharacterized protein n=1 Tax=Amblyomma cajennense TaxID=34607 RepID=A0A023FCZ6_AMBCJ
MTTYASLVALLALGVAGVSSYVLPTLPPHPLGGCPEEERPPEDRHCNFWCKKDNGQYSEGRYKDGLDCDFGRIETGVCFGGLCHSRRSVQTYGNGTGQEPTGEVPSPAPEAPPPEVAGTEAVTVTVQTGQSTEGPSAPSQAPTTQHQPSPPPGPGSAEPPAEPPKQSPENEPTASSTETPQQSTPNDGAEISDSEGPAGTAGPAGPEGPAGPAGPSGPTGLTGP